MDTENRAGTQVRNYKEFHFNQDCGNNSKSELFAEALNFKMVSSPSQSVSQQRLQDSGQVRYRYHVCSNR